jgi:DNA polymerase-3 subunit delta'
MDVQGNEDIREILFQAVEHDRLHHALLFHGPEGIGKRRTAFRLAMYRTCPERRSGAGDCGGTCPSCTRMAEHYRLVIEDEEHEAFEKQQHPDLFYLEPYLKDEGLITIGDKSKAGQKRTAKGKKYDWYFGSIRWLQEHLKFKPHEALGSTVIIDHCERIQPDARQSLLKVLEEPPPNCLFILVTNKLDALLATYRSRCQPVRFRRFSRSRLAQLLESSFGYGPDESWLLAAISGGSLGEALDIDLPAWLEKRGLALEMIETAATPGWTSRQTLMEMAEAISRTAKQWDLLGREIPDRLGSLLRDLVALQNGAPAETLVNTDLAHELESLAGRLPRLDAGRASRLAGETYDSLGRNRNRRLVVETMLLELAGVLGTRRQPA